MATKYVNSGAAGTASGDSWTDAYTTLGAAVTAGADLIKVHNAHSEALAADTTYTITVDTRIVCVNKDSSDALSTGALVGNQATNFGITLIGLFKCYIYGVTFTSGTGASAKTLAFGQGTSDGLHYEFEQCTFRMGTSATSLTRFGTTNSGNNTYTKLKNCSIKFGATGQSLGLCGAGDVEGLTVDAAGSAPTTLLSLSNSPTWTFTGCDLSHCSGTIVPNMAANGPCSVVFANCKLHASAVFRAAPATILNKSQGYVLFLDCVSGDTHYSLFHGDPFGETTAVADYYYTSGGASINTGFSWKIVTTANCSFYNPYVSPWFSKAHTGTSAVTLSIEGLRLSTTVIQDDEVWGEFSYKGTSGQSIATLVNDRQDVGARANGTAGSDQTSGVTYTAWTNGTSSHSAFKLATASTVTPAEIGVLRGRVVVGEPSLTVYIDPQVRVA